MAAIGRSEETRPWVIGDRYQRPIARRIVEEAGVPREAFGQEKRAGVGFALVGDREFLSRESLADYRPWIRRSAEGMGSPQVLALGLEAIVRADGPAARLAASGVRAADAVVKRPSSRFLRRRVERWAAVGDQIGDGLAVRFFAFPWAPERAAERYPMPARMITAAAARARAAP